MKLSAISTFVAILIAAIAPAVAEVIDGNRIVIIDGDTVALPCAEPASSESFLMPVAL